MTDYIKGGRHEAVKFLLEDDYGRILIETRNAKKRVFSGLSSIPAGHIDTSDLKHEDYALHALKRECMEELGIVPNFQRFLYKCLITVSDRKYRVFYYLCKGFDPKKIPKRSYEGSSLQWLKKADWGRLPLHIDRDALSKLPSKKLTIAVSGTPGTGKTTLAKLLSEKLNLSYFGLSEAISDHKLSDGYDFEKDCEIVSISVLKRFVHKYLRRSPSTVIDGHLSHYFSPKKVDICIICTSELKTLKKRLEKRSYSSSKVRENLDSEIFRICEQEAREFGHKVLLINTSKGIKSKHLKNILSAL